MIKRYFLNSPLLEQDLLQGLSHQFNRDGKRVVMVAGDNGIVYDQITSFINSKLEG